MVPRHYLPRGHSKPPSLSPFLTPSVTVRRQDPKHASAWPQDHWRRCCASQTPAWGGCQGRRAVPDDGGAGSRRGLPTPLRGTGPALAALIRAQQCREGPDTPCWRRAEPSVCSVLSAGLPAPGADTLCGSSQCRALLLAWPAGGLFLQEERGRDALLAQGWGC